MASTSLFAQDVNLTLTSPAFNNNDWIPSKYTCNGDNVNPPLSIKNIPEHTKSLVLIVHDPDAPGADFIHWAVYNIDPAMSSIAENTVPGKELINNFNQFQYGGPCPPHGDTHHYVFDLYALDKDFAMNENGSSQGLLQMMSDHILSVTQLTGLYKQPQ